MTPTEKAKGINLEVMQDSIRDARNKSIGNDAVCSTAAGTAAKTVTLGTTFELVTKATIIVKFENAITVAGATLNITHTDLAGQTSSTGAKDIYYRGAALPANLVKAGMSLIMRYNGTQWDIISNIEALDDYLQVNAQNFSNAQKLQARENINAQEKVTDMAKLGCGIGTCSTDSGTALVVSLTDYELVKNGHVSVNFEHDVPAGATLNINGKGAKPIIYKGSAIEADVIKADDTITFCYNGSQYVVTSLGGSGAAPVNPNETVNISLTQIGGNSSDLIGAAITITDDDSGDTLYTALWQGTMLTTEIDVNTNYTVSVETITGYLACPVQSYQAGFQTERSVTFQYIAPGAYIEDTDGVLYTSSSWNSSKTANSVVFINGSHNIRLALGDYGPKFIHSNKTDPIGNYLSTTSYENAPYALDGKTNTDKIIQFNTAYNSNTTTYIAPYCKAFIFPNGNSGGYLPASGEYKILFDNKTSINGCLSACGGTQLSTSVYYMTSNLFSNSSGGYAMVVCKNGSYNNSFIGYDDATYYQNGSLFRICSEYEL